MSQDNTIIQCSFCNSRSMFKVIDFGSMALAGGFLKQNQFNDEKKYSMRLYFCDECYSVQIIDKVDAKTLFDNYFYYSSSIKTLRDHFKAYAHEICSKYINQPDSSTIIEFGCNDGVLLKPLADLDIKTLIGVDPAKNVVETINDPRINIINNFFNQEVAEDIITEYGYADLVLANNVYAHIPDIQGITRAIKKVLKKDGVFIFEVHYLGKIINELQYDMIYHEHLYYYSLLSLQNHFSRYEMLVFDIKPISIHAGSMRFYVCKKDSKYAIKSSAVSKLENTEITSGFSKATTFSRFAKDIHLLKVQLLELLDKIIVNGNTIAGYGASGRANTMIQYCGINHKHLEYIIDDAPAKTGYYTPGSHFLIQPGDILNTEDRPDYLLIFAWSFIKEIICKNKAYLESGGKMIIPLPELTIIDQSSDIEKIINT